MFAVVHLRIMKTVPSNVAFTILIKINGRLKEFNFRKRTTTLYDVNTNDEYSVRYYFQLQKEDATWKISGQSLPAWILDNQQVIFDSLAEKME